LRRRILQAYLDDGLHPIAAHELARTMGEPVSRVSYHLKTLAQCDVIRQLQADEEKGPAEHLYAFAPDVDPEWLGLVLEMRAESDGLN
jgi:predicted transcriptional regulator